jgi:hypothetical protein
VYNLSSHFKLAILCSVSFTGTDFPELQYKWAYPVWWVVVITIMFSLAMLFRYPLRLGFPHLVADSACHIDTSVGNESIHKKKKPSHATNRA